MCELWSCVGWDHVLWWAHVVVLGVLDVVITSSPDPAELGSQATLTCTLQGGGTGTLEYEWTIGGVVRQQRSARSTFFIREAGVNNSRSDYGCTVYDGDTALPEVMGTLHVLSKAAS